MIQESGEMYLENILILSKALPFVRATDIADYMHFSKPSVSRALKVLCSEGYIEIENGGAISLTKSGLAIATNIYDKHVVLRDVLMSIGVDEITATEDACRMEHVLSDVSFQALKDHINIQKA